MLLATAAAPMLGVWASEAFGAEGTLVALSAAGVVNLLLVLPLLSVAMRPREPPRAADRGRPLSGAAIACLTAAAGRPRIADHP